MTWILDQGGRDFDVADAFSHKWFNSFFWKTFPYFMAVERAVLFLFLIYGWNECQVKHFNSFTQSKHLQKNLI